MEHLINLHFLNYMLKIALDLRPRGRGFESQLGLQRKNSGQVSHTYVPLSPIQWPKGSDNRQLGR